MHADGERRRRPAHQNDKRERNTTPEPVAAATATTLAHVRSIIGVDAGTAATLTGGSIMSNL
jgi:hypothetical protein